jgi:hypothetical protein
VIILSADSKKLVFDKHKRDSRESMEEVQC